MTLIFSGKRLGSTHGKNWKPNAQAIRTTEAKKSKKIDRRRIG